METMNANHHDGLTADILAGLLAPVGLRRFVRESFGKEPVLLRGDGAASGG